MNVKNIILILFFVLSFSNANDKIQIPFYYPSGTTSSFSKVFNEKINIFENKHKDIDVILKPANTYFNAFKEVMLNAKKKKSSGVIILEVSELPELVKHKAIISLSDFLLFNKKLKTNILDNFLKNSYYEDNIYSLPYYRSTPIVYYNMDILNKYGIKKSDLPKTWSELKTFLSKLKDKMYKAPLLLPPAWFDWLFESFVIQNSGTLTNKDNKNVKFNSKEVIGALEFWKELIDNGLMRKRAGSWKSTINLFLDKKYPIIYYTSGGMELLKNKAKFSWYASVMPKNKVNGNVVGATSIYLSNYMNEKEKEAAYKLLKYLFSDDVQVDLNLKSGYFSVTKSSYQDKRIIKKYQNESYKNAKEQLKYSSSKIMIKNYYKVRLILKKAINEVLDKNMNAKEALDIAQKDAQKYLE